MHYISVAIITFNATGSIFPVHEGLIQAPMEHLDAVMHYYPLLGASGALYGVLISFVLFYPNEQLIFLFIPYPIKAKYLIPVILLLDVIGAFGQFGWDPVAHFAHLGGAVTGYIAVRIWSWNRVKRKWN